MARNGEPAEGPQSVGVECDRRTTGSASRRGGEDAFRRIWIANEVGGHGRNRARGIRDCAGDGFGALTGESGTDPQVERRHAIVQQRSEALLREAESVRAGVARHLRKAAAHQRQVHANPVQRDRTKRHFDAIVGRVQHAEAGRQIGNLGDRTQQTKLVGRGLVVVQDDAAQQRQCASSVVRQTHRDCGPCHVRSSQRIRRGDDPSDRQAVFTSERFDFACRHRVHGAIGRRWAVPQCEDQQSAWLEQRRELAERALPVGGSDVLPHARELDKVKRERQGVRGVERGQPVVQPSNALVAVQPTSLGPHACRRLHCDYVEAEFGQPGSVAP